MALCSTHCVLNGVCNRLFLDFYERKGQNVLCIADFRLVLIGSQCGCWVHTLVYVLRFGFYGGIVCKLFNGGIYTIAHCADAHSQT